MNDKLEYTSVLTEDVWQAINALDDLPETHREEWYQRLLRAAEEVSCVAPTEKGWVKIR